MKVLSGSARIAACRYDRDNFRTTTLSNRVAQSTCSFLFDDARWRDVCRHESRVVSAECGAGVRRLATRRRNWRTPGLCLARNQRRESLRRNFSRLVHRAQRQFVFYATCHLRTTLKNAACALWRNWRVRLYLRLCLSAVSPKWKPIRSSSFSAMPPRKKHRVWPSQKKTNACTSERPMADDSLSKMDAGRKRARRSKRLKPQAG